MATSLLRSGRLGLLKCLQLESWGVLGSRLPASFCTKAEEPEKPVKKAKASGKTAEAVDGREKLLAYRTRVVFPVRLSEPGAFPAQCQGVTEPVVSSTAGAKTFVASVPVVAASEPAVAEQEATKAAAPTSDPAPDTDTTRVISGTAPPIVHTATEAAEPVVGVRSGSVPPEETAKDKAVPAAGASSEDSSSSSSSDSDSDTDSDSDSDSEDEDSAGKTETKTETKTSSPDVVKEDKVVHQEATDSVEVTKEAQQPPEATLTSDTDALQDLAAPSEAAQATVEAPSVSSEELVEVEAAQETIKDHSSPGAPNVEAETPVATVTKAATPETAQTDTPVETTETVTPETSAEVKEAEPVETVAVPMEATAEEEEAPRPAEVAPVETSAEGAAEVCAPAESTEELVDTAPVVAGAVGEELEAETPAEQSKEAAAAAAEPEEPFDNSTYKNCQHHSYNPYTFADLDLQMAKFRLPQPSSGRPSPRH